MVRRLVAAFLLLGLAGCQPLYQSWVFTEPVETALPVAVAEDEVWIASIPAGADVYLQPYDPERLPSHATDPEAYRGKTPLHLTLPPGSYLLELALDAEAFAAYFAPPFEDVQFERADALSEALLFQPFAPRAPRRVLRYYRLEKAPQQGQTLIALFHPRGEALERVAALYPLETQFRFAPAALRDLLQRAQVPAEVQETFLTLLARGGKAFWSLHEDYKVSLEVRPQAVRGRIVALYTGPPLPDPLLPDGGGL
ncbi:MAG: hypothetical protein KatS3mg131_3038 [Candidatus Tectimicrobiota bacterium]|nr:MAG: hypothetical protein KatS3mg131_3038 [Candidatus Tectomicrobia bacterium]